MIRPARPPARRAAGAAACLRDQPNPLKNGDIIFEQNTRPLREISHDVVPGRRDEETISVDGVYGKVDDGVSFGGVYGKVIDGV